jgi:hypothetical protein
VCAFFCVCVQVEALRRADHPPKETYRMSKISKNRSEWRVHGGRPRPTGAVVPRKKNDRVINEFKDSSSCGLIKDTILGKFCRV